MGSVRSGPYEREIKRRVGWAKSGFYTAARMIAGAVGLGQLPKWMKQPAPGSGRDETRTNRDPYVALENQVGYVSAVISNRQIHKAQGAFEVSLAKDVDAILQHEARRTSGVATYTSTAAAA